MQQCFFICSSLKTFLVVIKTPYKYLTNALVYSDHTHFFPRHELPYIVSRDILVGSDEDETKTPASYANSYTREATEQILYPLNWLS